MENNLINRDLAKKINRPIDCQKKQDPQSKNQQGQDDTHSFPYTAKSLPPHSCSSF